MAATRWKPMTWNYFCAWLGITSIYDVYSAVFYGLLPIKGLGWRSSEQQPIAYWVTFLIALFFSSNLIYVAAFSIFATLQRRLKNKA